MLIKRLFSHFCSCVCILPPEPQEPKPVNPPEIQPANQPEPSNPIENEPVNQHEPESANPIENEPANQHEPVNQHEPKPENEEADELAGTAAEPEPETEEAAELAAAEVVNEDEPEADNDDKLDMLLAAMKERGKRRGRLETIPEEPEAEARALFDEADELAAVAADLAAAAMVPPKRPEAKGFVKKMKRKIKKIFESGGIEEKNAELDKIREEAVLRAFTFMPM